MHKIMTKTELQQITISLGIGDELWGYFPSYSAFSPVLVAWSMGTGTCTM